MSVIDGKEEKGEREERSSDESLVIARNIQDRIDGRSRSREKRIDGDLYAEYLQHRFSRGTTSTINSTVVIGSRNQPFGNEPATL